MFEVFILTSVNLAIAEANRLIARPMMMTLPLNVTPIIEKMSPKMSEDTIASNIPSAILCVVYAVSVETNAPMSIGLKTNFYKYMAILIGALCCGLAGANLSTERLGLFTNDMTAGRGFIAIAAIYCGQGSPVLCAMYAILFGLARALSVNLSIYAGPAAGLFDVIPYIIMVCVLTAVSIVKHKNNKVRGFKNE